MESNTVFSLHFSPLISPNIFIFLAIITILTFLFSLWKNRHGIVFRCLCVSIFLLTLAGPSILQEEREFVNDVAVVVIDKSLSQSFGNREEITTTIRSYLENHVSFDPIDIRFIEAPLHSDTAQKETKLFSALDQAFRDVPYSRRAGAILITDGQVHDVPTNNERYDDYGPIHSLLTGGKNEKDRRLRIVQAPAYGIVGQTIEIEYIIEDTININQKSAEVSLRQNDGPAEKMVAVIGQKQTIELPIDHNGQNIFELSVEPIKEELTTINNRTALSVNGVRDRLKVLLVSGQPHAGGRTWRNLLTADPGVDLVHFTILREPNKLDATPQHELALIAFPFRELFEIKLYDFDLIIFDRYRLNHILPTYYFANIARYVEDGGALLEASGPSFADKASIYNTALNAVLPGRPIGNIIEKYYKPEITSLGQRHPVTKDLYWNNGWGGWLRQIPIEVDDADIVMSGENNQPLLVLDRVQEGRVAQLATDQIWLWSRGYDTGGPQSELLRRLAHWLMKEPQLDENGFDIHVSSNKIHISRRSLHENNIAVLMTKPDGSEEEFLLSRTNEQDQMRKIIETDQLGVYSFSDGTQKRFAVLGDLNKTELSGIKTTEDYLKTISLESEGSILWLNDVNKPQIKILPKNRKYSGPGWIGLRQNNDYDVVGVVITPALPVWLALILLIGLTSFTWWKESKI